jgi:hypothetical protein
MPPPTEHPCVHAEWWIVNGARKVGLFFTEGEIAEAVGVSRWPPPTS